MSTISEHGVDILQIEYLIVFSRRGWSINTSLGLASRRIHTIDIAHEREYRL